MRPPSIGLVASLMYVSSEGIPLYFPREIETKAMALTETSGFDTEDGIEGSILERIVGGEQTRPGAYPFFVRIDNEGSQHCGGSLISSDVVLTAAHCFASNLSVAATSGSDDNKPNSVPRSTVQTIQHPGFDIQTFANDFMLLILDEPVVNATLVELNIDPTVPVTDDVLTVIGLGSIAEIGGIKSEYLKEVHVNTASIDFCREQYLTLGSNNINETIMFCGGTNTGGNDACQGDSGGPILNSEGHQVGVVSFGWGCGLPDFPGVYARVSSAHSWISGTVCQLSQDPPTWCRQTVDPSPVSSPGLSPSASALPASASPSLSNDYPTESPAESGESSVMQPTSPLAVSDSSPSTPLRSAVPSLRGSIASGHPSPTPSANAVSPGFSPTEMMFRPPSGVPVNQASEFGADTVSPSIGWFIPSPSSVRPTFVPFQGGSQGDAPSGRAPGVCDDFDERPFSIEEGREKRDCAWLRQASEETRTRFCQEIEIVFVTCEETCGKCEDTCDDIEHVLFKIPNINPWELTDCAWLRARRSLVGRVCIEGSPAFYLCQETCNICGDEYKNVRKSPDDQRLRASS